MPTPNFQPVPGGPGVAETLKKLIEDIKNGEHNIVIQNILAGDAANANRSGNDGFKTPEDVINFLNSSEGHSVIATITQKVAEEKERNEQIAQQMTAEEQRQAATVVSQILKKDEAADEDQQKIVMAAETARVAQQVEPAAPKPAPQQEPIPSPGSAVLESPETEKLESLKNEKTKTEKELKEANIQFQESTKKVEEVEKNYQEKPFGWLDKQRLKFSAWNEGRKLNNEMNEAQDKYAKGELSDEEMLEKGKEWQVKQAKVGALQDMSDVASGKSVMYNKEGESVESMKDATFVVPKDVKFEKKDGEFLKDGKPASDQEMFDLSRMSRALSTHHDSTVQRLGEKISKIEGEIISEKASQANLMEQSSSTVMQQPMQQPMQQSMQEPIQQMGNSPLPQQQSQGNEGSADKNKKTGPEQLIQALLETMREMQKGANNLITNVAKMGNDASQINPQMGQQLGEAKLSEPKKDQTPGQNPTIKAGQGNKEKPEDKIDDKQPAQMQLIQVLQQLIEVLQKLQKMGVDKLESFLTAKNSKPSQPIASKQSENQDMQPQQRFTNKNMKSPPQQPENQGMQAQQQQAATDGLSPALSSAGTAFYGSGSGPEGVSTAENPNPEGVPAPTPTVASTKPSATIEKAEGESAVTPDANPEGMTAPPSTISIAEPEPGATHNRPEGTPAPAPTMSMGEDEPGESKPGARAEGQPPASPPPSPTSLTPAPNSALGGQDSKLLGESIFKSSNADHYNEDSTLSRSSGQAPGPSSSVTATEIPPIPPI